MSPLRGDHTEGSVNYPIWSNLGILANTICQPSVDHIQNNNKAAIEFLPAEHRSYIRVFKTWYGNLSILLKYPICSGFIKF